MINDTVSTISKISAPSKQVFAIQDDDAEDEDDAEQLINADSADIPSSKRSKKHGRDLHPVWQIFSNITNCHMNLHTPCGHCGVGVSHHKRSAIVIQHLSNK